MLPFLLFGLISLFSSFESKSSEPTRKMIDLKGTWNFALDSTNNGIIAKFYALKLTDSITLPGTLDENGKGFLNKDKNQTKRLSRERTYGGFAWYQKEIDVPADWDHKNIRLLLERTKPSKIWIDTIFIGSNNFLLTPQIYDLSEKLKPGKQTLTILIDNGPKSVPKGIEGSHAWTEHTQTNWNGIIGNMYLEATNNCWIENVGIFPNITAKTATVKLVIQNQGEPKDNAQIFLDAKLWNSSKKQHVPEKTFTEKLKTGKNLITLSYPMGDDVRLWSEFSPELYKLSVRLKNGQELDNLTVDFGMRSFSTHKTQFQINGTTTFLRGKHDACVFPLTAHPPMDVETWRHLFQIAKSYGINYYRFHTWTPPDAAFEAADIEGIYMQPELPYWGSLSLENNLDLNEFLLKEGRNIQAEYGNHPSFVMLSLGNELGGDSLVMKDMVSTLRNLDNRPLFSYGSNNYLGEKIYIKGADYLTTCRVGADKDSSYRTHTRASFSFADANDGGYINGLYPSTNRTYETAIANCPVPVIGHEVGQYQIYPNYDELKKYTGVLKPWNFEIFRKRLDENKLSDQAKDFFRASGAASLLCYRADIEMALRTPGFGGFHLLDLQDFPGQGTALIGILDAFMDSKGLISPDEFMHFCNQIVPLLLMDKYCWSNAEKYTGKIEVANYSPISLKNQEVKWELKDNKGLVLNQGKLKKDIAQGGLTEIASLSIDLSKITETQKSAFTISLPGTKYSNSYPLWIYPTKIGVEIPSDIEVFQKLDSKVFDKLNAGAKVLLFPDLNEVKDNSVGGLFTTDYWNYSMFKSISEGLKKPVSPGTMGILTDPKLPLFNLFPTEFHTNWQWWSIIKNSRPFILDNTAVDYRPLVQVIDNIERNHKLGLIFEFAIGKGKLLTCMSNLLNIKDKPEATQLYKSILAYMSSENFSPKQQLTIEELQALFSVKAKLGKIEGVKNISY